MNITKIIYISTLIFLTGCESTKLFDSTFHTIAGSTVGWDRPDIEIISDSLVNGLQVRRVRMSSTLCTQGFEDHLELNGPIGTDSTYIIGEHLRDISKQAKCISVDGSRYVTTVYMNSPGGYVDDGYALGELFKKHGVQARVTKGQVCASSCAIAFLGGKFRSVEDGGVMLFHAPYTLTESVYFEKTAKCNSKRREKNLKSYYIKMLGNESGTRLFDRTMAYCSSTDGWLINADAAKIYRITNS